MAGYRRLLRLRGRTRRDIEAEVAEEIDAHLELVAAELVRGGMAAERARAAAAARFGDRGALLGAALERERNLSRRNRVETLLRDLRLAARHARREPGTSSLSIATFALGIGLATAMFTALDAVLLRPLPYERPHELVTFWGIAEDGRPAGHVSMADWVDLRDRSRTLSTTAIYAPREVTLMLGGRGRMFSGAHVTRAFFDVLRTKFVAGRGFDDADVAGGAIVISDAVWRTHLGSESIAGLQVDVDGQLLPVVGVVPAEPTWPASTDVWVLRTDRAGSGAVRNNVNWSAIARLAPGVMIDQAQADLAAVASGIRSADPAAEYMYGVTVTDLASVLVAGTRTRLVLLFGAVCLVLLIGCSNVATLALARTARRRSDIATRLALGASRGQVFRQHLTEQLALACAGGLLGVLIAYACITIMKSAAAASVPRLASAALDPRILMFALGVTLLAGIIAGWLPALRASTADPHTLMARRGVVPGGRLTGGATLLAGEVALAVLLLVGGGLLMRSLANVIDRDVGFDPDGVAAAYVILAPARFAEPVAGPQFWDRLLETLRADPSVASASLANWVPTATGGSTYLEVEGVDGRDDSGAAYRVVSEDYFTTMRMPIVRGRAFDATDAANGERVAIINELLARKYWPDANPIGARIRTPGMEGYDDVPWLRIVGVTADVRHGGHENDATMHVYVLQRQRPEHRALQVLARARTGAVLDAARVIEDAVASIAPDLAVTTRRLEDELASLTAPRRLLTGLLAAFAALALLLAATGIFGLFSYAVAQRKQEFGVRSALGADRRRIMRLVLGDALRLVATGCAVGLIAAFWLTRLLRSQLDGLTNTDPLTYVVAFVVIIAAALLAAAVPGLRAARVDPQTALRSV